MANSPPQLDPTLAKLLEKDKAVLATTHYPVITVSASFKEDLKQFYGLPMDGELPDIVFSRAHYSMALAMLIQVWGKKIDPARAWLVDPTNYVDSSQWRQIVLTETIGKILARQPVLKTIKDLIDRFGRRQLPILKSITPPLWYLTEKINRVLISLHIAAGNILVEQGHQVIQVITDPHVRDDYLFMANRTQIVFCVFDQRTKLEFLEKAAARGLQVDPERVVVTGPPVDPRIIAKRTKKTPYAPTTRRPLRLCVTTGGLGTNKTEILQILNQLIPTLRQRPSPYQILVYAGTQKDIYEAVQDLARTHHVKMGSSRDPQAALRVLYHPQIVDANELLVATAFAWADGFITKPSGDMAYDAVAAGCFLLTLSEWGEWEQNIREIFEQKNIARRAEIESICAQIELLRTTPIEHGHHSEPWITQAMTAAQQIEPLFLHGCQKILRVADEVNETKLTT